ncbi:5'-nucleotidase domain-containing protein [Carex littledalei]|uniref:5'-nucleotidase domain-containing protein n=1 Tax=Carex littledalei TaxID=544730 RepID=A0A833QRV8_9POAL|nr:5'-nucleotidase domain-containing protein [Carex littledalei]
MGCKLFVLCLGKEREVEPTKKSHSWYNQNIKLARLDDETVTDITGDLGSFQLCYDIEKDTLAFRAVDKLLQNQVYYHGSLKSFLQITKWKGPEVGRHVFDWFLEVYLKAHAELNCFTKPLIN